MRRKNPASFILFILFLLCGIGSLSQDKNRVGVSIGIDKVFSANARVLAGFSFERILHQQNGAEIGFYYRSTISDKLIIYSPMGPNAAISEQFFILEKFLSVPLIYNYRSKTVNISMGVSADIFAGWKEEKYLSNPPSAFPAPLQDYKFDHKILWGGVARVSKTFRINEHIHLEPVIYYNPIFTRYSLYSGFVSGTRQYLGALVSTKFVF